MSLAGPVLTPEAPGERRAALALHALGRADRDWLLGQLDAAQGQRLAALLTELDGLGAQFDPADIEALLASPTPASDDLSFSWLHDEPAWLRAALASRQPRFAPAAQRALAAAAMRRRPLGSGASVATMRQPAPALARASWWQGVRKWMP